MCNQTFILLPMERMFDNYTFQELLDGIKKVNEVVARLKIEQIELEEENKKLKETIKDHQLYEEKLEHRIIEFEELLH